MSAGDREAEAQAKKGEDGNTSDRSTRMRGVVNTLQEHWCLGLRITELILAVIAIGLIIGALFSLRVLNSNHWHMALIFSAYSSFIIITGVLIIARLLGETVGWKTSMGFSIIGFILFTATAGVIFYDWHQSYYASVRPYKQAYDLLIASGVFAVVDAAVFLIHVFFTMKKEAEY